MANNKQSEDYCLNHIKLIILDVDGTLTDGGLYLGADGNEYKKFDVKDGKGIVLAEKAGIKFMILTGRRSRCVEIRAHELGIEYLQQGECDKLGFLKQFMQEHRISPTTVAYVGDDVNDIPCMKAVGLSVCPNDAVEEVKGICDIVLPKNGGHGAVRCFTDMLIDSHK